MLKKKKYSLLHHNAFEHVLQSTWRRRVLFTYPCLLLLQPQCSFQNASTQKKHRELDLFYFNYPLKKGTHRHKCKCKSSVQAKRLHSPGKTTLGPGETTPGEKNLRLDVIQIILHSFIHYQAKRCC